MTGLSRMTGLTNRTALNLRNMMRLLGFLRSVGNHLLTLFLHRLLKFHFTVWTNDRLTKCLLGDLHAMMFLVGVGSSKVTFTQQLVQNMAAHEREFCEFAHDVRSACCVCDDVSRV